jgi:hypothetical protein
MQAVTQLGGYLTRPLLYNRTLHDRLYTSHVVLRQVQPSPALAALRRLNQILEEVVQLYDRELLAPLLSESLSLVATAHLLPPSNELYLPAPSQRSLNMGQEAVGHLCFGAVTCRQDHGTGHVGIQYTLAHLQVKKLVDALFYPFRGRRRLGSCSSTRLRVAAAARVLLDSLVPANSTDVVEEFLLARLLARNEDLLLYVALVPNGLGKPDQSLSSRKRVGLAVRTNQGTLRRWTTTLHQQREAVK